MLGWQQHEQAVKAPQSEADILLALPTQEEKPVKKLWPAAIWQIAAAVALLMVGYWAGRAMSTPEALPVEATTELSAMRQELASLKEMLQSSASTGQRLQAVTVAAEAPRADTELLMALIQTMHFDDNVNVRMAAVEALMNYRKEPQVRRALINSLSIQNDPNVQLMLIQGLTNMQEKEAVPVMQDLLKQKDLQMVVRQKIQESLSILI